MNTKLLLSMVSTEEIEKLLNVARQTGASCFYGKDVERAAKQVLNILTESGLSIAQSLVACLIAAESQKFQINVPNEGSGATISNENPSDSSSESRLSS